MRIDFVSAGDLKALYVDGKLEDFAGIDMIDWEYFLEYVFDGHHLDFYFHRVEQDDLLQEVSAPKYLEDVIGDY